MEIQKKCQISDLALWLDTDDTDKITSSANKVSLFDDKSGNDNDAAQAIGDEQPETGTNTINGRNVIDWDIVDDNLSIASDASIDDLFATGGTIVYVTESDSLGEASLGRFTDKTSTGGWVFNKDPDGGGALTLTVLFSTTPGDFGTDGGTFSLTKSIIIITYDASNTTNVPIFYTDGAVTASSTFNAPVGTVASDSGITALVGNNKPPFALANSFDGRMGEVLWYKRIITDAERGQLNTHLSNKWGIPLA